MMAVGRIGGGLLTLLMMVVVLGVGRWVMVQASSSPGPDLELAPTNVATGDGGAGESPLTHGSPPGSSALSVEAVWQEGHVHGRVITDDGESYEGRLRWGGDEEALWTHYFNGSKAENPWVAHLSRDELPRDRWPVEILGFELFGFDVPRDLRRPFMARLGDVAWIEPNGRDLRVGLKSGTVIHLDRFGADDVADGLRVWDERRGVVDLSEWSIERIEFGTATGSLGPAPLYGTVRTADGWFTGLVQWDRTESLVTDGLRGLEDGVEVSVSFADIRSIERTAPDASRVTLADGRGMLLGGTRKVGQGNQGIYVDDARYGRVLVSWMAFDRLDLSAPPDLDGYEDFEPGRPLHGTVTTRSGRQLAGRIVYDLDESETTETLDAPWRGVDYTIPFRLIETIVPWEDRGAARLILTSGEELRLEAAGDLGATNAGVLVFRDGADEPEYVPWPEVRSIDFDHGASH